MQNKLLLLSILTSPVLIIPAVVVSCNSDNITPNETPTTQPETPTTQPEQNQTAEQKEAKRLNELLKNSKLKIKDEFIFNEDQLNSLNKINNNLFDYLDEEALNSLGLRKDLFGYDIVELQFVNQRQSQVSSGKMNFRIKVSNRTIANEYELTNITTLTYKFQPKTAEELFLEQAVKTIESSYDNKEFKLNPDRLSMGEYFLKDLNDDPTNLLGFLYTNFNSIVLPRTPDGQGFTCKIKPNNFEIRPDK